MLCCSAVKSLLESVRLGAGFVTSADSAALGELVTGEGIQIKYRINLTDSWTTLGTYTITNIGTGVTSFHEENIKIPECEQVQIRVELLGAATTSPEFIYLILI